MKNFLLKACDDGHGFISSMRVAALFTILVIMIVWTILSFCHGNLVDIPMGVYIVIGLVTTGKVVQTFSENK